jgi:hypothetical protein
VVVETIEDARNPPVCIILLNGLKRGVMSSWGENIFLALPPLKC